MSFWGTLAGGFVGTLVLTTLLRAASELRLTRIDLPFLLGTIVTADRLRAKAIGYLFHFFFGFLFALGYYAVFRGVGRAQCAHAATRASASPVGRRRRRR